jgi:hypothetical protein
MKFIKRLFLAMLIAFSFNVFAANSDVINVDPKIIGKTYLYDYGGYAYNITITSKDSLHWQLVKGSFEGPDKGVNPYIASQISDGIIFISWKEESGYQFFNIMNLNTGILTTHADAGGMFINMGKVSLKE